MSRLLSLLLGLILITVCFIIRLMTEDGKLSAHVSTDLADVSKLVTEVVTWKYGLSIALWDQKVINIGYHDYVEEWQTLLNMFNLNPGEECQVSLLITVSFPHSVVGDVDHGGVLYFVNRVVTDQSHLAPLGDEDDIVTFKKTNETSKTEG